MTDKLSKKQRSWNMSRIKSANTKPELLVRSLLHNAGYRFRLNGKVSRIYQDKGILPGKPDIVLAKHKTVIFVHGCFWHRHKNCKDASIPKTRTDWWLKKLNSNVIRDKKVKKELKSEGWKVIVVWECETKPNLINKLSRKLIAKLSNV